MFSFLNTFHLLNEDEGKRKRKHNFMLVVDDNGDSRDIKTVSSSSIYSKTRIRRHEVQRHHSPKGRSNQHPCPNPAPAAGGLGAGRPPIQAGKVR